MTSVILTPRADVSVGDGVARLYRLVRHLVADGDRRAQAAGQQARRTLAEMTPEYTRSPLLVLHRPRMNDACAICGSWLCRGKCWSAAPAPAGATTKAVSR
ncbi:hypothetical protein HRW18_24970 [Streptomyces lunaelactis]|uniref:hypothetical protein n=1 Tax=Streptomyces lunaelactis TaxID=1535768 RepID=UPI001585C920|nr:hypothetical protein [Streptomyces lunaelactis]NUK11171.1 hypothetical protein [Streptomyces lunaelactis]NUK74666.1 hypothetical protein [Streptomyces lunaelactis]NUL13217.1 hypothetical protein [Streptomyces lunaelactis]NUL26231.1 hypothetical protein [Streptomyces lunaelactis]